MKTIYFQFRRPFVRYLFLALAGILPLNIVLAEIPRTADDAVRLALAKNPDMRAARALLAEAEGRGRTTGRLANPELEAELAGGQDYEGRVSIGLTQRFPLTSRLRFERQLSAIEIETANLEIRQRERQLAEATRNAFYELAAVHEARIVAGQQSDGMEKFAKSLRTSVSEGFGTALDAGQAELETDGIRVASASLDAEEALASVQLCTLLGIPAETRSVENLQLTFPASAPAARTPADLPDVRLAELAVESGAVGISLAKASRWDDVGVGLFVEGERFRDEPEGIEPEALLGVRMTIPLPFWQDGSGLVAEKQASAERRAAELEAIHLAARNEVATSFRILVIRFDAAQRIAMELIPAAANQLNDAEAAHARGEADIQTVFRARERLTAIQTTAVATKKQYYLAYSHWLYAVGAVTTP